MKTFTIGCLFVLVCFPSWSQAPIKLTQKEAQEDLKWLRFSLEYVHPRLYKYDDKPTVDRRFDQASRGIENSGISGVRFLSLVSKLNAKVNCGHLYTIPQYGLRKEVLGKKVMPFYVKVIDSSLYVFNDCSPRNPIPNGAKIVSINGKTATQIYQQMQAGIATDGYINTRKNRLIERYLSYAFQGFDLYYFLHVDQSQTFNITYASYPTGKIKQKQLRGMTRTERRQALQEKYQIDERAWYKTPSPRFKLVEDKGYAVLTIARSFYNKKIDPNYDAFLQKTFATLKAKKIQHLIIDLRNNEGGSEHQQMELMAYLYNKPFKLYQHIYQSHIDFRPLKPIIVERDTSKLLFNNDDAYMRKFSSKLWVNNYKYSKNLRLRAPKKDVFEGQLYVLMNGSCFSSASDLIADIRKTTNAILIGEESGGTFEGPTGGISIVVQLPHSKIMVRISPNIHIGSLYKKHPFGKGVLPNHQVNYSITDLVKKRDLEMEKAVELIRGKK
ncbi:hypothetical protein BKI52_38760 [marine bacterium AO1-C]|nr:hypothetical protein BKI52_38760 [marine bacterium AO1-C]